MRERGKVSKEAEKPHEIHSETLIAEAGEERKAQKTEEVTYAHFHRHKP